MLIGLAALTLAACASDNGGQAALAKNQVFVFPYTLGGAANIGGVANKSHDATLDPAILSLAADSNTADMLYSGLVTYGSNLQVVPDAATSWEISPDGKTYTFHLRPNLRFSDGTPLTAADFAYSMDRSLDPTICALDAQTYGPAPASAGHAAGTNTCTPIAAGYLNYILGAQGRINGSGGSDQSLVGHGKGLDAFDQQTLIIRLSQPISYFLEALTYPTSFPVERSLIEKYPGGLWVDHLDEGGCSGPFQVKSYGGGQQLILIPNHYWEQAWNKQLTLTEVDRPLVTSQEQEYKDYHAGQYDYTEIPPAEYSTAVSQDGFNEIPSLAIEYFGMDVNKPPFDKVEIRQAFDLSLNKQLMVDRILAGGAYPTNHFVPRGMPGYDQGLLNPVDKTDALTGDQTAAAKLIQQVQADCKTAGNTNDWCPYVNSVNGAPLAEVDIRYRLASTTRQAFSNAAAQTWSQVLGLNVQSTGFDGGSSTFYKNVRLDQFQVFAAGWIADYPDPQDWLSLQFSTPQIAAGNNLTGFSSQVLDKLMGQADINTNQTARMQQYNVIEQQLVDASPEIPYNQAKAYWLQRSWVHGFGLNSLQLMPDINWPGVYILDHSAAS